MPPVKSGMILIWSGSVALIPGGYRLCDGTFGTPDLRDRFILGAGGAWAVDASGGATSHTHNFTGDGHAHTIDVGGVVGTGANYDNSTSLESTTGITDSGSSMPPYYALAFIMKT